MRPKKFVFQVLSCNTINQIATMSQEQPEPKRKRGRPVKYTMPEPIPDTAENIAKAILFTPPKKPNDWKFMREFEGDTKDLEG